MYGRNIRYICKQGDDTRNVLIFFHGMGESGSKRVKKHGPLAKKSSPFWNIKWTIVYPMCPWMQWWDPRSIKEWIDEMPFENVHIAGVSMGAYLVWSLISLFPTFFKTAIPVSGGANPLKRMVAFKWEHIKVHNLTQCTCRVWAFHGSWDMVVPVSESIKLIKLIPNSKITIYNRVGHQKTMRLAFSDPNIIEWITEVDL